MPRVDLVMLCQMRNVPSRNEVTPTFRRCSEMVDFTLASIRYLTPPYLIPFVGTIPAKPRPLHYHDKSNYLLRRRDSLKAPRSDEYSPQSYNSPSLLCYWSPITPTPGFASFTSFAHILSTTVQAGDRTIPSANHVHSKSGFPQLSSSRVGSYSICIAATWRFSCTEPRWLGISTPTTNFF